MEFVKNFKNAYVASTIVIYFEEDELTYYPYFNSIIKSNVKFLKISSTTNKNLETEEFSRHKSLDQIELSWNSTKEDELGNNLVLSQNNFFNKFGSIINNNLSSRDIVIIVYKNQNEDVLKYVDKFIPIFKKNNNFVFHYVIDSFVKTENSINLFNKVEKKSKKFKNVIVNIGESNVVQAYKDADLSVEKRNFFISKFLLGVLEGFMTPFLLPSLNSNYYSKIKKLYYSNDSNFINYTIPSIGFSDNKFDWIDISLIKALTNPIFYGSYKLSKSFVISLKSPYLTSKMIGRIEYVFKSIFGEEIDLIVSQYIGDFDVDIYAQLTVLALDVKKEKLIYSHEKIKEDMKNIIDKIQESKHLFADEETKTMMIDLPISRGKK